MKVQQVVFRKHRVIVIIEVFFVLSKFMLKAHPKSVFYFAKVYVYVRACSPYEINQQIAFHLATSYWTIESTNYNKLKLAKSVHLNTQTLNCVQCDTLTLTLKYNTI